MFLVVEGDVIVAVGGVIAAPHLWHLQNCLLSEGSS